MRKLLFFSVIMLFLAAITANAERIVVDSTLADIVVTVLESSDTRTVIKFDIGAYDREEINISGDIYYKISCGEEGKILNEGAPELPMICRSIIIPDDAQMAVNVLSSNFIDYHGTPVAPSKGSLLRTVLPDTIPYTFGDAYFSPGWSPVTLAEIGESFIFRDYRGLVAELNAFQYNHQDTILRVYNSVTLEVVNTGPGGINVFTRSRSELELIPDFEQMYERRFINYDYNTGRYPVVDETGEILIITADAFHNLVLPLVEWKLQKGIKTTLVNVSTIGNTVSQIYNYIDQFYDTHNLAFVLLVGDAEFVAVPYDQGDSDPYYSRLDGTDNWPEIFVGRLSASNNTELETQILRTVNYEKTPFGGSWYQRAAGVASNLGPGDDGEYDYQHLNNIRTGLLSYGYTLVDQIYDPTATSSMVTTALNNGRSLVNYTGHGDYDRWVTSSFYISHVNSLTNEFMLPLIISVACYNGDFVGQTCFAEAWLRATNNGNPTGAIAAYMSSVSQSWYEPMEAQDEANFLIVSEAKSTIGGICYNGSCKMMETYAQNYNSVQMFKTWHIFGDPSVQLFTKSPAVMAVSHDANIEPDAVTFDVTVSGIEGALCALFENGILHGSAYTNSSGIAVLPIDVALPTSGEITLTVTAFNQEPYIAALPIGYQESISFVIPSQNALDVMKTSPIFVVFNQEMDGSTFNNSTFKVIGKTTGQYPGTVTYYTGSSYATFTHTVDFKEGEEITVVLTDGLETSGGLPLENGYTWSFTTASCASADFGPSIEYATYANPNKATAADFNGDGFVDIATSSQTRNYVSILLNNGSGGFPTHTDTYLGDSHGPNGICAADFTGDGYIDLATSNYASDNVTILANNGYGGFSIQGEYQVVDIHGGCYPADMNGDGSIDLVIGIGSGIPDYIAVFYNNGNGTFSQLTRLEVLDNPFDPKAADFNNDGALDLVIVNAWSDSACVFLNDGEGGFGPRVDYYTGDRPLEVATADLNGDGFVDFAVSNKTDNKVTIHMNDGNGGFGLYSTVSPLYGPEAINAADFDGDGDMDLVTANRDDMSVTILWNNGSASFTIDALDDYCDTQMYCSGVDIVAADLDSEGSIDLFTVNIDDNGTISVMKNFGPPDAPELYSPVNGKVLLAPAQPTLNCNDVATAIYYNFQIDDDPDFGSPISSPTFLAESQWTVSQSLSAGTYYWHARAINSCGYGQWSDVWTIVVTNGGGSSCPVLFSHNGREFIEENPLLTACEKSGYVDIVTDYYHVNNEVVPVNGKVTFQLKEVEDEITYLDSFELITVDHSTSTGAGCSVDGRIFTYQTSIAPLSVIDQDGTDWTAVVQETDGDSFASEISGALLVVFPNIESSAGISIDAVTKSPCPYEDPGDPPKAAVNNYAPSSMVVEQLTADGSWIVLSDIPSRENSAGALIMNDPSLAGNAENITIRITWEGRFSTDEIRQYIQSDETPLIRILAADNFRLNLKNPAPKVWQGFESSGRLELRRDEFIEFSFDVDNIDDPSMTRDYIIRAVGRYHPDYSVFTHLMPNQFQLYNNYPNPFNPSTKIAYDLPSPVQVKVDVINILGRHVATLVDESQPAGHYEVIWNGRDNNGSDVSSGIYLYRLTAGDFASSKKMILQK